MRGSAGPRSGKKSDEDRALDRAELLARIALLFIVALGLGLRLLGISFGLPYHHHWDEGWIVDSVAGMLRHHNSVPASYQYGAPLMRLTELAFVVVRWVGRACCDMTPAEAQTTLYLVGRVVTALVSSTGILAIYMAARRTDPVARISICRALAASLLYAVASELVLHSRFVVTDACLVALTAWTLAFAARYLTGSGVVWGALSVLAAGVTFAFKAPGIATSVIPLLAGLIMYRRAVRLGQPRRPAAILLAATIPVVFATYVLLNPHVVDRSSAALGDLVSRYRQTRDGGVSSVYLRQPGIPHLLAALGAIVTQFPSRNVMVSLAVSALVTWGFVVDLRKRNVVTAVAAVYAACLVLSVALPNRAFLFRNYLVVIPSLCLGFGAGVVDAALTLSGRLRSHRALRAMALPVLGVAIAVTLVGLPLFDAIEAQRHRADPRSMAIDWISQQVEADEPVEVATTPSVFGKSVMGAYPQLRSVLSRPELKFTPGEIQACPIGPGGPRYVIDASYRDTDKAPSSEPWREQWLFRECPGYEQVASFEPSPYEINLRAYPTWPGRISAIVLRRTN